ncbi:copper homeostasis protein CutC [Rhodohalobacter sp. 614A]|uniref:copper homeostasis protein CutC n=1 Tax=Rhodohalobacter sp. 614A TaxID=2908649 RepID=UPI001F3683E1|nr:copper homeostasis protein CutC [Rhodohalobacter sp. 614A]
MAENILLESPVFNIEAALKAYKYGVDRLELCSSYPEGGLTPGAGLFTFLKSKIDIPIFVMIRPRGGNFVYSAEEVEVMKEEIRIFSSLGADGFVFGILDKNGSVQKNPCKELVDLAGEKPCTFHRAFDASADFKKSLDDVIDCGFKRILTSGGKNNVSEGLPVLLELLKKAKDQIIIMPGGGMMPELMEPMRETAYLKEVHASCKKIERPGKLYENEEVQFSTAPLGFNENLSVDQKKVLHFKSFF